MTYAQIKNGIVVNIIELNSPELETIFSDGFDALIRIDEINPTPSIDWSYSGETFEIPQVSESVIRENGLLATISELKIELLNKLYDDMTVLEKKILLGLPLTVEEENQLIGEE